MYLENNINKIKNNFSDIYDKYQRFFKHTADKEKNTINYEILSSKVVDINFYGKYGTLCEYLNHLLGSGVEKNKLFLEDLSKVFKLKKAYATSKGDINYTEKAYDDLVLNNKTIDDVLYEDVHKEFSKNNKNIFQEAKKVFNLRVKIYKKLFFETENLNPQEAIAERAILKKQRTEEEKETNNIRWKQFHWLQKISKTN